MVDKAKTKKVMKQFTPVRANLASVGGTPFELPNHSRGKEAESDKGLVNKKYVDDAIAGITFTGATGNFTAGSGEIITVENGLITFITSNVFIILLETGDNILMENDDRMENGWY